MSRSALATRLRHRLGAGYRAASYAVIQAATTRLLKMRLFWQVRLGLLEVYQPHPFGAAWPRSSAYLRACEDRLEAISARLPPDVPLSVLDVGCNVGYFVFRLAERGGLCIGVDSGRKEILAAQALAGVHDVPNAVFARLEVTPRSVAGLPECDVVLCLSVFHHWARAFGEEGARRIMAVLASRARRCLVFETGGPEEAAVKWARDVAFMGPDPDRWIRSFLAGLGFDEVRELGRFPASVSNVPRPLYLAARQGGGT